MSILKRVLTEAISSLGGRSSAETSKTPVGVQPPANVETMSAITIRQSTTARPGLKAIILNWNRGENDPFSVVNATIRQHFVACGKNVEVVEVSAPDWADRIAEHASSGIDFAFTWQGITSATKVKTSEGEESLWDFLRIPLICVHGDHPSHMPLNHELESPYCFHLYTNADFARYSNRHFRRMRSASVIDLPMLHREPRLEQRLGDFFVIAKNVDDPTTTEDLWRQKLDRQSFDAHMAAAETLKFRLTQESYVELHDVLDELIEQRNFTQLHPSVNADAYHFFHSRIDHYMRSYRSILALAAMREFPVRIYGRGWDRVASAAPKSHVFEPGRDMANSQELFYSRYGIVDISPSKWLHDRTRRALANESGFLSSANPTDRIADTEPHERLFYSFKEGDLAAKCANVMSDPDGHVDAARRFARLYHQTFHFTNFVDRIDQLVALANRFEK